MDWFGVSFRTCRSGTQAINRLPTIGSCSTRLNLVSFGVAKAKAAFLKGKSNVFRSRIPVWRGMLAAKFLISKSAGSDQNRGYWVRSGKANDRACVNYFPKAYDGTVTDIRPAKQYRGWDGPELKWKGLARGGEEIIVLPVNAPGMLGEPFVKHLAAALRESVDEAIRKNGTS